MFIYSNRLIMVVADLVEMGLKLNSTAINKIATDISIACLMFYSTSSVVIISRHW